MSIEDLVGQTIMMGVNGTSMLAPTCDFLFQVMPGGVFYRGGNVIDPWQLRSFSQGLQDCAQRLGLPGGLLIAIDHEGEVVYRYDEGATVFPSAMAVGAAHDEDLAFQVAYASGQELAFSGVNMIFGPVADVLTTPANSVISIRAYGGNAEFVARMVSATVEGYLAAGVLPVLKHFPGHGSVAVDSHLGLPIDDTDLAGLTASHLVPFSGGIDAGARAIMISHVAFPAIDPSGTVASLSSVLLEGVLRGQMGYEGIAITDALGMGAISSGEQLSVPQAAVRAIVAGEDMVIAATPYEAIAVRNALLDAVQTGALPVERLQQAVRRILTIKLMRLVQAHQTIDVDWGANQALALEVSRRAVTVVRDSDGLVPLPGLWQRVLVVCPYGLGRLTDPLAGSGISFDLVNYSAPRGSAVVEQTALREIPQWAAAYDGVIVCTWDAYLASVLYGDTSQIEMVTGLQRQGVPTIVVALRSPFDLLGFPDVRTYVATFGTTDGQLAGVGEVLVGQSEATGLAPVDLGQ
jgi:beta-N-acetylhexosaminidase